jgi:tRNA(adenine34) deaminase
MNDEHFMQIALDEAAESLKEGLLHVGAVIVQNGIILGSGRKAEANSYHLDHAEIIALRNTLKDKKFKRADNLVLYTTLEPCIMCYGTILHCPISKIVFAAPDVYGGATKLSDVDGMPIRHKEKIPEIIGGVMEQDSRKLIKEFLMNTTNDFYSNKENLFVQSFLND